MFLDVALECGFSLWCNAKYLCFLRVHVKVAGVLNDAEDCVGVT